MSHSKWFERGNQKFSHKKFFFQNVAKWKERCEKKFLLLCRCPLLLDRSKQFIRRSLLLDRFTLSVVDRGLKRQHRSLSIRKMKGKINDISIWNPEPNKKAKARGASYAWVTIVVHCMCEIIIQNWNRFNWWKHLKGPGSSIQLLESCLE